MKYYFHKVTISSSTLLIVLLLFISSCQKERQETFVDAGSTAKENPKSLKDFIQVNLVGNNNEYSPAHIDPNLINGWGIAFPTSGPAWVSSAGASVSTVYLGDGTTARPPVAIPGAGSSTMGVPTGQVFNSGSGFLLPNGNPARFIFAGADGAISAWNTGNSAVKMIDDPGEAYLGITIANDGPNKFLYVANFSENEIEVYDTEWNEVSRPFVDPNMPAGYAPFNIQAIDNLLYVMYAKRGVGEEEPGPGNGYVDIYNPNGTLVKRFISRGQLNAPWGIAKAPVGFWNAEDAIEGAILVGNFGDGRINVYSSQGAFLGQLREHGNPIVIEGLWGIAFAPSTSTAINQNWLYFAAGPDDEEEGLFGYIRK